MDVFSDGPGAWVFAAPDGGYAWTYGQATFDSSNPMSIWDMVRFDGSVGPNGYCYMGQCH